MKLLKDEVITQEQGSVKIGLHPLRSSQQMVLASYAAEGGESTELDVVNYALKNLIDTMEVKGKTFVPDEIADRLDINDPDTVEVIHILFDLIYKACFASDKEKKG